MREMIDLGRHLHLGEEAVYGFTAREDNGCKMTGGMEDLRQEATGNGWTQGTQEEGWEGMGKHGTADSRHGREGIEGKSSGLRQSPLLADRSTRA